MQPFKLQVNKALKQSFDENFFDDIENYEVNCVIDKSILGHSAFSRVDNERFRWKKKDAEWAELNQLDSQDCHHLCRWKLKETKSLSVSENGQT